MQWITTSSPGFQRVIPSPTFHTIPDASEPPMWWPYCGMVAIAEDRNGLAAGRPHVVVVHAGSHDAHDHLEGAGLRDLDVLELEGVHRFAFALLADDPRGHRRRKLTGLGVDNGNLAHIYGHSAGTFLGRSPFRGGMLLGSGSLRPAAHGLRERRAAERRQPSFSHGDGLAPQVAEPASRLIAPQAKDRLSVMLIRTAFDSVGSVR